MHLPTPIVAALLLAALLRGGVAPAQTLAPGVSAQPAPAPQVFLEAALIEIDPEALGPLAVADVASLVDRRNGASLPGASMDDAHLRSQLAVCGLDLHEAPTGEPVPGGRAVSRLWSVLRTRGAAELLARPHILASLGAWATIVLSPQRLMGLGLASPLLPDLDGLELHVGVRAQTNDAREIRLEVAQEGRARGAVARGHAVRTALVVRDGQSVLLRGLTLERGARRRVLVLIVTPHLIASAADLRAIFEQRLRERQEYLDQHFIRSAAANDRGTVNYARTHGMMEEIHQRLEPRRP